MIKGFSTRDVRVAPGIKIRAATGGSGPPILLLHGFPQTHVCWRKVAPALARDGYSVVAADLRGYGDSSKPRTSQDHAPYSKRAMAADQVALMRRLGHERFAVVGHDRGARVAHRMALDHPDAVEKIAVLDIAPTATMYARTDRAFATLYWHWFFLIQPFDLPERMIGSDPGGFIRRIFRGPAARAFEKAAVAEYVRCFSRKAAIHGACEDYRAAASIDLVHDKADEAAGRMVEAPLLALWGRDGIIGRLYEPLAVWREKATKVSGHEIACGHFLPEEAPEETLAALRAFFG
jgi:haloacetate dehalogenase